MLVDVLGKKKEKEGKEEFDKHSRSGRAVL